MTKDEALKLALDALRKIAEMRPFEQNSVHGIRMRCQHCWYAWLPSDKAEHGVGCAYVTAHNAIKEALAQPAQEPVAGKGKEYSEQLKLCARNVAFVSAGRVDMSSAAMQEMFALIDHVCAGIDSLPPPAQPEQEPDDLTIAYMSGLHDGKKRERALWTLTKLGQEIEAQPSQEPTATYTCGVCGVPMQMEQPTKRQWVGLTDEERDAIEAATLDLHGVPKFFATAIEAKLRSKNT
jgi:hypothetical protein